jgi:hypothetical protein
MVTLLRVFVGFSAVWRLSVLKIDLKNTFFTLSRVTL